MEHFRVVVCGFDPYEDVAENPCREVCETLARDGIIGSDVMVSVTSLLLPISFHNAWPMLLETLEEVKPHVVIATGLKSQARSIALERCATHVAEVSRPDVDNAFPHNTSLAKGDPHAYWTELPLRAISKVFAQHDIPATLSSDAGTYVCNSLFYELLKWSASQSDVLAGFISFPLPHNSVGYTKGMDVDVMVDATEYVISTTLDYRKQSMGDEALLNKPVVE